MWTKNVQMFKLDFKKAEEPKIKLPTSTGSQKYKKVPEKHILLLYWLKPLSVWITTNCGKFLEMGIPDHLTCLLRNLYAGQEATVRTSHGTMDWFQIEKEVHIGGILPPYLFNLYEENHARCWAGWGTSWNQHCWEKQNNLRYADDTILMAENEEELKNFLMKVKEESENAGLKLNIQKMKIMVSSHITSWQIDGKLEIVTDFIVLGSKIFADGDCSHEIKGRLLLGRKAMTNLDSILKSRNTTLLTKVCLVKAMVIPVIMYGCESWTIKKRECWRIDVFLESPLDCKETKPVNPKGNQSWMFIGRTDAEVETPILWPPDVKNWLIWKDPDAGKDWRLEEKGMTEDKMVGCNHPLDAREFE